MSETRVLIADDHLIFIDGLKHILKSELNIEITGVATNGKEAIQKCNEGIYDLVIMDINMPIIDGIYACKEIKSHNPEIKIIFLTMMCDLVHAEQAIMAGADGYVFKGNSSEELIQAIKEIRKGKLYLTESLRHFFQGNDQSQNPLKHNAIKFVDSVITKREREILKLIAEGYTNDKIAEILNIAIRTVDTHRSNMLHKLNLSNSAALVKFGMKNGLIE